MPTVQLYDNNHSGLIADITFSAITGGSFSLGLQTIPYTFSSDYPYGTYSLYYSQWGQTCSVNIPEPPFTITFNPDGINNVIWFIFGSDIFDMSINWGDGSPIDSSYIGNYYYIVYHHYSTIGTYNVIITLTDYTVITVIASGSIYNLGYDNVLSVNNFQLFTNPNFNTILFQGNRLSTDNVNNLLIAISGITTYTSGYFDTSNQIPPACPTGNGILALNHLVNDLFWTVQVDTGCP
jgi:hypothetical protein